MSTMIENEITYNQVTSKNGLLSKRQKNNIQWLIIMLLMLGYAMAGMAQNPLSELNYVATSTFVPILKDAVKFSDVPEIKDSVKRIENIKYGITSMPLVPKYEVQKIDAAKLQNEPLPKLYHSLLKLGYGPIYNMPYGEFWISNIRSRDVSFGAHLKHFSSTAHLKDVGYSGFADDIISVYGKRLYNKYALSGDFNYQRNMVHYYGYDPTINFLSDNYTKQRYQLFEPRIQLQSHYTDSTHFNNNTRLSYYNLQNLNRETENNVKLNFDGSFFLNKEKLSVNFLTDYYNHKQSNDTLNDLIMSLTPNFEAGGKKWHIDIGFTPTMDRFKGATKFYMYEHLNIYYDVYDNMVIPYAGVDGGLKKNSFRSLSSENPFVDTTLNYTNTSNPFTVFGGLKGTLSSKTSYDVRASYARYNNLYFFVINYGEPAMLYNHFKILYDDASLFKLSGEVRHQATEKLIISGKGNYYYYKTSTLVHAYQKPDYDLTFSGIYNLQSKFIIRADFFIVGKQWAQSQSYDGRNTNVTQKQLPGYADLNLEGEYRYSKMLSFFARFNNIANQRYYRWDRYPSQRFNFMIGVTFVPF